MQKIKIQKLRIGTYKNKDACIYRVKCKNVKATKISLFLLLFFTV